MKFSAAKLAILVRENMDMPDYKTKRMATSEELVVAWPRPRLRTNLSLSGVSLNTFSTLGPPQSMNADEIYELIEVYLHEFIVLKAQGKVSSIRFHERWLRKRMELVQQEGSWLLPLLPKKEMVRPSVKAKRIHEDFAVLLWWASHAGYFVDITDSRAVIHILGYEIGIDDGQVLSSQPGSRVVISSTWDNFKVALEQRRKGEGKPVPLASWRNVMHAAATADDDKKEALQEAILLLYWRSQGTWHTEKLLYRGLDGGPTKTNILGDKEVLKVWDAVLNIDFEGNPKEALRKLLLPRFMGEFTFRNLFPDPVGRRSVLGQHPRPDISEILAWQNAVSNYFDIPGLLGGDALQKGVLNWKE